MSPAYGSGVARRTSVSYRASSAGTEIDISSEGSYQPAARSFVFVIRPAPVGTQASLDGHTLPSLQRFPDFVSVQFADDGRPHKIRIN